MSGERLLAVRGRSRDGQLHEYTLYSPSEAGALLGISRYSVVRLIDAGLLRRAQWAGRSRKIIGAEIHRYACSQIAPQPGPPPGDGAGGRAGGPDRPPLLMAPGPAPDQQETR